MKSYSWLRRVRHKYTYSLILITELYIRKTPQTILFSNMAIRAAATDDFLDTIGREFR